MGFYSTGQRIVSRIWQWYAVRFQSWISRATFQHYTLQSFEFNEFRDEESDRVEVKRSFGRTLRAGIKPLQQLPIMLLKSFARPAWSRYTRCLQPQHSSNIYIHTHCVLKASTFSETDYHYTDIQGGAKNGAIHTVMEFLEYLQWDRMAGGPVFCATLYKII